MTNYNLTQTGAEVQVILDRVAAGYIYMGTADLTTTPDTTNPNVCYLLTAVGTYTNFGNIQHASGIGIALWSGSAWSYQNVPSSAVVATDVTPTEGSVNPVQSGGVASEFDGIEKYQLIYSYPTSPTGSINIGQTLKNGEKYFLFFDVSASKSFDITLRSGNGSTATIVQTIAPSKTYSAGSYAVGFVCSTSSGSYLRFGSSSNVWSALSNIGLKNSIMEMPDDIAEIKATITTPIEKLTVYMDFGGNLFDKGANDIESNYYVSASNGNLVANSSYNATGFIHLIPGETYTVKAYSGLYGSSVNLLPSYSADKVFVGSVIGTYSSEEGVVTFVCPPQAYYMRFTIRNTEMDSFMLVKGDTYPSTYKSCLWSPNRLFDTSAIDADFLLKLQAANPLYGKLIAYDGDSIARGADDTSPYGWSSIIAAKNNGTYISRAAGGGTITDGLTTSQGAARHCICTGIEAIANNNENPDYIIFEGGTNDADVIGSILDQNNLPEKFGTWNINGYTGPYDKETFCGAVEYMFQKALTLFPHAKFGFIIAQKMGRSSHYSATDTNRRAYFGVIMDICKKWGIPYINLWDEGFLCPSIDSHYNPSLDREGNIEAHSLYIDGQHLTLEGYQSLSSKIDAWIKTL